MNTKIQQLQSIINDARHIVFFTGAGVSTGSGIPDFRSQDGLYNQKYDLPPEEIISHHYFVQNPEGFFRFYKDRMIYPDARPNIVHTFIAECEKKRKSLGVVTQNIDGLHQLAGSQTVYELHGSVLRNYCEDCCTFYPVETILESTGVPHCPKCGGIIKPDVVLYEEGLSDAVVNGAVAAIQSADVLIVLGTSLVVYPAAGLLRFFGGKHLVLINRDATPYDSAADLVINDTFDNVFPYLHV
ncbi:MAG: NAD-dependent protein deacylase [Bulleidia sp.]